MQNVRNAKSAIHRFCVLNVLPISPKNTIQTSVDRGGGCHQNGQRGTGKKVSFLVGCLWWMTPCYPVPLAIFIWGTVSSSSVVYFTLIFVYFSISMYYFVKYTYYTKFTIIFCSMSDNIFNLLWFKTNMVFATSWNLIIIKAGSHFFFRDIFTFLVYPCKFTYNVFLSTNLFPVI